MSLLATRVRNLRRRNNSSSDATSIRALIAALGGDSVVVGFWDYRYGISQSAGVVDSWADVRGAAAAVSALLGVTTARPAIGANGLTFDGVDDRLLTTGAGLQTITSSCWAVLIARGTTTVGMRDLELSIGTVTAILDLETWFSANVFRSRAASIASVASSAQTTAAPRIFHGRVTSTVDVAGRIGNNAEVATAQATGDQTATQLAVGSARSLSAWSALTELRAVILGKGVYTAAQVALINAWAQATHGAVLTN